MTGLVRKAAFFTAVGLLMASAALAGVPSPCDTCLYDNEELAAGYVTGVPFSNCGASGQPFCRQNQRNPSRFILVGTLGTQVDELAGRFQVHVKDLAGNPISGASVVVDLSNASDMRICDVQEAGATVACTPKTVRKFADINGWASFTIAGGANPNFGPTLLNGARIYANGTLYCSPSAAAYDLDDASGVGANDLSVWLTDFGTGNPIGRSDYDRSIGVGANDLSLWLTEFGAGTSAASCATPCPNP